MFLIGTFLSLAAMFVLLEAYFLAVIQVLVYAGAVMVLFFHHHALRCEGIRCQKNKRLYLGGQCYRPSNFDCRNNIRSIRGFDQNEIGRPS